MKSDVVVDADSHVEEPQETWQYLDEKYADRRPVPVTGDPAFFKYGANSLWFIDGNIFPKMTAARGVTVYATPVTMEWAKRKSFSVPSQTLLDPDARLEDMDKYGIDVQVNYPTVFLEPLTEDPDFETALSRSYNTFMATQSSKRPDRLKWGAVLPLRRPREAAAEVRRAKELGAVAAITTYGTIGDQTIASPELDPVWAELERTGLPIAIHCGWSNPGITRLFNDSYGSHVLGFTLPVLCAFHAILGGGVLDRYPRLKVLFLEAGCEWIPWLVQRMDHYYESERFRGYVPERKASEYLRDCQVYFTTEAEEANLPLVLQFVGEDRIMIACDQPHEEAREGTVGEIRERNDLTDAQKRRVLGQNAVAFYKL
jgi:predicted TIM-barrel fold metal-dependent hydrolase